MTAVRARDIEAEALRAENAAQAASNARETLDATIRAAELYMQALKITDNDGHKKYLDSKCKGLVQKAETIKAAQPVVENRTPQNSPRTNGRAPLRVLKEPTSSRPLPKSEQILLWKGSELNGFKFPPWPGTPAASEFETSEPFIDHPELHLSAEQREIFDGWKRPQELCSRPTPEDGDHGPSSATRTFTMEAMKKIDLVQDLTSDCSVVASLSATSSRAERGHSRMLASIICPYDHDALLPKISGNGRYVFRLYFNGCYRKVVVDDRLPSSKTSRALHVVDRNNPGLLWPALLEKAYLKVRGGYDFPGSNSGTDLWVISNWIPEQIFLHQEDLISDEVWNRVYKAFNFGDVVLTVGTGKLSRKEERLSGLAGEHDYAILDMKKEGYRRMVLIKNPWSEGSIWKDHQESHLPPVTEEEKLAPHQSYREAKELSPGSFWMNFSNFFQYFESLYLNWNPALFSYRQDVHFVWNLVKKSTVPGCFATNPQYAVKSIRAGPVWLLLSRHFKTGDYVHSEEGSTRQTITKNEPGFISLYAFKKNGERVFLSDGASHRGPYVDSPNTLLRFEMPADSTYTVVVSEQSLPRSSFTFTLSAFSIHPLELSEVREKFPFSTELTTSWTPSTAGGNADSPLYTSNPQFALRLLNTSSVVVLLEAADPEVAVHVKIFRVSNPESRVTAVRSRDIYANSGDYRRGCALVEKDSLDAGNYAIVCSTFAKGVLGKFTLRMSSSHRCSIAPLPAEGAGRLRICPDPGVFPAGVDRLLAPVTPSRLTRARFIAQHSHAARSSSPSPVKMSLELGQGPYKKILAVSNDDDFNDAMIGVRIEDLDLHPGMERDGGLWLVLQRLGDAGHEGLNVEILSEEDIDIGRWGTGSG